MKKINQMSLVRRNLMTKEGYAPYCSKTGCMMRTVFNGEQFDCPVGHFTTAFPAWFIKRYKRRWGKYLRSTYLSEIVPLVMEDTGATRQRVEAGLTILVDQGEIYIAKEKRDDSIQD